MKKMYLFALSILFVGQTIFAQSNMDGVVKNHLTGVVAESDLTTEDISDWKVTNVVPSLNPDIQHVYIQQYHQGIPIQFAMYKLTVKNNTEVTWEIDQFVKDITSKVTSSKAGITPEAAIMNVVRSHNLQSPQLIKSSNKSNGTLVYEKSEMSLEPIEAQQVYMLQDDKLVLTWRVSVYQNDGQHWWNENVDASTGKIIHTEDWVISCNFGTPDHTSHKHNEVSTSVLFNETVATVPTKVEAEAAFMPNSYNVYPVPIESPNHGNRSIVTDPANAVASPFGWHDTNGSSGAEFTITRGNNVWAQDDSNGNNGTGFSPNGGGSLEFDFPINFNQAPSAWREAAITNLFYWNNIIHDVFYQYGFDEASGNFQENNYGNGGAGSDSVNADAQDGSGTNNANFSTPGDGGNPRMQMFLFTNPTRDGDLDNVIIAHEYGHGISTRLVGGPSSNGLSGSSEQMGEGWSDWFGLMLTMKPGDVGTTGRGVGTYATGQPTTGNGIRPTPYSTNRSINNTDYADIGGLSVPHGVGYGFATILWDMTWALIDEEGFDEDLYNGTGGNNIAMALVIEGLKNTQVRPGYVSGRDGILQADQDLYGGQYECLIWNAFASRGVGEGANENNNGGTNTQTDQTVSFVNPCDGGGETDGCDEEISSFPYSESFEGSIGDWSQVDGDDLDWTVDANGTPSNGTGPSSAIDGNSYIYVEASGNGTGFPTKRAILNSPCLDFSGLNAPSLNFQYHMVGSAVGTLTIEARTDNSGEWVSIFTVSGAQGTDWNQAAIELSAFANNDSVQLRLNVVTGNSWQGDIAIDDLSITNTSTSPPSSDCDTLDFSDFTISPFADQDINGNFSVVEGGDGLSLSNNTWKVIALDYEITANTVIEFDFRSTSQGEIHGLGFENDNELTADLYFKVFGTQDFGITNFDNYTGGVTTYAIPVGNFYTGSANRLVFINDNDAGSGNTSIFSNVRIYEGSCDNSVATVDSFGPTTKILGNEGEEAITKFAITPNPLKSGGVLQVSMKDSKNASTSFSIINMIGQTVGKGILNDSKTINVGDLETGMYLLKIEGKALRFIIE